MNLLCNQYGATGLHLDGHSSGSLTTDNAQNAVGGQANSAGSIPNTTVNLYGPAANALDLAIKLDKLRGENAPPIKP